VGNDGLHGTRPWAGAATEQGWLRVAWVCIQSILFWNLRFVNMLKAAKVVASWSNTRSTSRRAGYRTHVRCRCGAQRESGELGMELVIKVVLVGYVLYAVLGAPMVSTARQPRT
jgi:hypothetical protein